jgi:hypothetical protein
MQLQQGIDIWHNFRLDGVASINFSGFNLYKNITMTNNQDSLKIVLYESGIFGSSPKPFAQLAITDSVALQLPFGMVIDNKTLQNISHDKLLANMIAPSDYQEIIENGKLIKEKTVISFNEQMQISEIFYGISEFKLNIEYDLENKPVVISGYDKKKLLFQIEIDKFTIYDMINEEQT